MLMLFMCSMWLSAAAVEAPLLDQRLAALFAGTTSATIAKLPALVDGLANADDPYLLVTIGLELGATPAERVEHLRAVIQDRRAFAVGHRYMVGSLADALSAAGNPGAAATAMRDGMGDSGEWTAAERADALSVEARIALDSRRLTDAEAVLGKARAALRKAVPDPGYETWTTRLTRHRLDRIAAQIQTLQGLDRYGPACWAWLNADRSRSDTAYQGVVAAHPNTIFAHAAQVERARLRLDGGDPAKLAEAMASLQDPKLLAGSIGAWAQLTFADAAVLAGNLPAAQAALESVQAALRTPPPPPDGLSDAQRTLLIPAQPMHRFNPRGRPMWETRPTGVIMIANLDPGIESFIRYQTIVRQAVMARVNQQRQIAIALATSLVTLDEVDRAMAAERPSSGGGHLLAYVLTTDDLLSDSKVFDVLPPALQVRIHLGLAHYAVFDWAQSELWLSRSLADTAKAPNHIALAVRLVQAFALMMLKRDAEAM